MGPISSLLSLVHFLDAGTTPSGGTAAKTGSAIWIVAFLRFLRRPLDPEGLRLLLLHLHLHDLHDLIGGRAQLLVERGRAVESLPYELVAAALVLLVVLLVVFLVILLDTLVVLLDTL